MANFFRTYRIDGDRRIDGVFAMSFIHNGQFFLTHISIYADGMVDCWGLVDFATFKEKVRSGWVVTQLPEGADVSVSFLAKFKAKEVRCFIAPEDFILEVADEIERLNGRPTTESQCLEAWKVYQNNPSPQSIEILRSAYEAVPKHNRRYILGDMDSKDFPIKSVLYPKEMEELRQSILTKRHPDPAASWWRFWKRN